MDELTEKLKALDMTRLPKHVAIIMDGNGRWARQQGLPRSVGHYKGVESVRKITEIASDLGLKYLTIYAFSTENWNRPKEEVDILMHLIGLTLQQQKPDLIANNVKVCILGDMDRIPDEARLALEDCRDATAHCTGLTLSACVSYSSRWEVTKAAKSIAEDVKAGILSVDQITEELLSKKMVTYPMPDPDLLIRSGGEERISNYLLWQIAYSELYFTDTLWPDFGKEKFVDALIDYQQRERRYGKTSDQVSK